MSSQAKIVVNPEDTIKILIATDIHLGFQHNKKRGQEIDDTFTTFEEILQHGKENEVDFILLGGDLFHDTKPSQSALLKCMELLRKYCLGSKEIKIQFLSDPAVVFRHCPYKNVNYEDPNLNISMPIFSIHGNHDDPSMGSVGVMDLLSVSGFINYFGKWTDLTKVCIPPLIIKKGETNVVLYGLSYINDQRLSRLIRDYKVDMLRPKELPSCFNILVLHQNRVVRKEYAYIPENKFPDFLNLVVWGHEHECRIAPEYPPETSYCIVQPGSSVATSLCESEAELKHIGLLSVNKEKYKFKALRLETVRPFVFDNLVLSGCDIQTNYTEPRSEAVYNFVNGYIENSLIPEAATQLTGHPKQPIQPLIRLRIFYTSEEEIFDGMKLASKYCDEVANPVDMVVFRKEVSASKRSKSDAAEFTDEFDDMAYLFSATDDDLDWNKTVQDGIKRHFCKEENKEKLTVLSVNGLNEALNRFIDVGDMDAFKDIVNHQVKKTVDHLEKYDVNTSEDIIEEIKNFRNKRLEKEKEEQMEIKEFFNDPNKKVEDVFTNSDEEAETTAASKGKGTRGKGTTTRGKGSRGGARGKAKNSPDVEVTANTGSVRKQTKKMDQSKLDHFMGSTGKAKQTDVFIIDDSD